MMLEQYLPIFISVTGILVGITLLTQIIGVNLYNIRASRSLREQAKHPHAARYRRRPLVTVVVATHNDEQGIVDCLQSIIKSSYRKVEIVVADNVSSDTTKQLVKDFADKYPKRAIRLLAKRKTSNLVDLQKQAYKKYGKGEIIFTLRGDEVLEVDAIKRAVMHFNRDDELDGLRHHQSVQIAETMRGLFQRYQWFLRRRSYKVSDAFALDRYVSEVSIWRKQAWARHSNKTLAVTRYADDVVVQMPVSPLGFSNPYAAEIRLHRVSRLLLAGSERLLHLLVAFMGGYSIYLAARFHETSLLIVAWLLLTVFVTLAIWDDGHLGWRQKISYTLGMPVSYVFFVITGLLQAVGAVLPAHWLSSGSSRS